MIVKSSKNVDVDKSPVRMSQTPNQIDNLDPSKRKSINVFNFMSAGQPNETTQSKPKVIEVNRVSFGRDMSAGAPAKRETAV